MENRRFEAEIEWNFGTKADAVLEWNMGQKRIYMMALGPPPHDEIKIRLIVTHQGKDGYIGWRSETSLGFRILRMGRELPVDEEHTFS